MLALTIGLVYVLITLIIGDLFQFGWEGIPFLSPTSLFSFLLVFGGVGTYVQDHFQISPWKLMSLSIVMGFKAAFLISVLVLIPLKRSEVSSVFSKNDVLYSIGVISVPCSNTIVGEVVIVHKGVRIAYPCLHSKEQNLQIGTKVSFSKFKEKILIIKEITT